MEHSQPFRTVGASDPETSRLVALLASEGIDDLAKLRIVQFLWQTPNVVGDASFFARVLGFHSASSTQRLLDELATRGLLARWPASRGGPRYGVPRSELGRSALDWLRFQLEHSPALSTVVRALAERSLAHAQRAAAERRRAQRRALLQPVP